MDVLARKRARTTESLPSTKKKQRQKPLLPGSYSKGTEGQGVVALPNPPIPIPVPVPIASPPLHSLSFHLAAIGDDDTYQVVLRNQSRWNSTLLPSPSSNWDYRNQPQDVVTTTVITSTPIPTPTPIPIPITTPTSTSIPTATATSTAGLGFTTQPAGHSTLAVHSGAEVSFPIVALEGGVVIGGNDSPPAKSHVEKWHAHRPPLSFVGPVSHPSMSYTDAHSHSHGQSQPTDLDEHPFSPGNVVANFAQGFTGSGFGVANDSNFEPLLIDTPTAASSSAALIHSDKLHLAGDDTSLSTLKFAVPVPALHCHHHGHAPHPNHFLSEEDLRYSANHEVWYDQSASTPSLELVAATHTSSPQSRPSHIEHLGFGGGFEPPSASTSLNDFSPHPSKTHIETHTDRPRRSRGQMQPVDREETSKTRKRKACIRCRMQKIRCVADPCKPETECCLSCRKVLVLETKKVIHRIPCLRWNLNDVVLFRVGGLGFTKRWAGVCVENIEAGDWADERIITIGVCITKLLCDPMKLRVRRFKPNSTDIQYRHWREKETTAPFVITMPAYALADVNDTSSQYQRYVGENAEEAIRRLTADTSVHELVRRTFYAALDHAHKMSHDSFKKDKVNPARLFCNYFRLWFASRFTLGSAYVADGHENLEGAGQGSLYGGKQFVSRMITAQFDSIGNKHVLQKLKRLVLEELWATMQKRCPETFFTVYLIVFMMLHEVAVACQDRRRRAKEQGLTTYYDLEEATAKIKHGADIILGHWHYYKGDLDPLTMNSGGIARAFGDKHMDLIQLLMSTCRKYEHMKKKPRQDTNWEENPIYLVSQMFERNWQPMQSSWP